MGKHDKGDCRKYWELFTLQIMISVVLTAVLLIWNRDFSLWPLAPVENTIEYGVNYMNILCAGDDLCRYAGNECVYHKHRALQNRYAIRADRKRLPILFWTLSLFSDWTWTGSCPGWRSSHRRFLYLGGQPGRKKNVPEDQKKNLGLTSKIHSSMPGAGCCHVYHAGK